MPNQVPRDSWAEIEVSQVEVLVVEDAAAAREEYCELLGVFGYKSHPATDGSEALNFLANNPNIGIVLTDVDMPTMDGLTLLGELQVRFVPFRPLVPVVVTGLATLENAVEAMLADAADFLPKPVSAKSLASAMRRASARWNFLCSQFRLLSLMENKAPTANRPAGLGAGGVGELENLDGDTLKNLVRTIQRARQKRGDFMDTSHFADPAWDIMLDLTSAALEGRSVPVLSASFAANVPVTTALRYVRLLVSSGMVKRWDDPTDKRRSLLALEDEALEGMVQYLSNTWRSFYGDLSGSAKPE